MEPKNTLNWHVPPGGYEQPARRILEIFQKRAISQKFIRYTPPMGHAFVQSK